MKYRSFLSLTDDEIIFAMEDIFHCTEIYHILRYKKNNEIHVKAAIPFQDDTIRETVILEEDKLQAPWIDSWEEEKRWEQFLLAKGCHSLLEDNPYLEQSYYLVSSNGYDIKYASYCSKEAAVGAMKQAYEEAMPEEWDEDCEEMSYLADEDAILHINGIAILVWKIIPQSDFQSRKVPLPVKKKEILIDGETATQIENDLKSDDIKDLWKKYDPSLTDSYSADFGDGIEMDIRFCCGDLDDATSGNPLWTEAVLFENGVQVACTDTEFYFLGKWELEYMGTRYCVEVKTK